jgi:hypothetical protein
MDQNGLPDYVEKSASEAIVAASTFIDDVRALAYSLPEGQRNLVHPVRQIRSPLQATFLLLTRQSACAFVRTMQVITPRFVPTCSDALLTGLGKLAQVSGARCQSHMCEAQDQVDWVRSMKGCADEEVFRRVRRWNLAVRSCVSVADCLDGASCRAGCLRKRRRRCACKTALARLPCKQTDDTSDRLTVHS